MRSQVPEAHSIREVMFHEIAGCLRKQHLPSVAGTHDACCAMDIQTYIAFSGKQGFTGMQSHPQAHCDPFVPGMCGEDVLRIRRRCKSIRCARKGHKEG